MTTASSNNPFALIHEPSDALDRAGLTLAILVMDESGSMERYGDAPRRALNRYLQGLRESPVADHTAVMLATFSRSLRSDAGLLFAHEHPNFDAYLPDDQTRLYASVRDILRPLMAELKSGVRPPHRHGARELRWHRRVDVLLAVYTDGEDNLSTRGDRVELTELAGRALKRGWQLLTFGYGVDAKRIAKKMGFPHSADHARTMIADERSIHQSMAFTLTRTIVTATGVPLPSSYPQIR